MFITNYRVTYQSAPQQIIDCMMMKQENLEQFYKSLLTLEGVEEAVILQTCNRFEIFLSGKALEDPDSVKNFLKENFGEGVSEHLIISEYLETLKHLFEVVSSIDSLIVGENQILAQVKEAAAYASSNHFSGKVLGPIFQKAISVGKKVRSETDISKGKVSISSAAVELANRHLPLEGKKVIVVGTGKMASLLAEYLQGFNVGEVAVIGRSQERHKNFCNQYSARPIDFKSLQTELKDANILFSATSCPSVLITKEIIEESVKGRDDEVILVDIAMPADIDGSVTELEGVKYFNIDDLREISEQNITARKDEVEMVRNIIKDELDFVKRKLQNLHMDFYLSNLMQYTEEIRQKELDKANSILGNNCTDPDKVQEVLDGLSKSLVSKVMHNFVTAVHSNPAGSMDLRKFVTIFMGNSNGKKHPDEAPPGHPHHKGHGS